MERILRVVLVIVLAVLLYMHAASLFVTPVPDSIRWYGDESWLMTEAIATVETGTLHHPAALSSTLHEGKGILFISVPWTRTLVYGIPAYLTFPNLNPVDVGRVVSFLFGLLSLGLVIWVIKRRTHNLTLALSTGVILLASRAFFFASHSARYDLVVGIVVLVIGLWIGSDRFRNASKYRRWFWLAFTSLMLAIGLPVHLYAYLAAIGIVGFVYYKAWREWRSWAAVIAGIIAATGCAILIQLAMTGSISIWSSSQHQAEITDVTRDIPLFRIFSLSAQLAVVIRNAEVSFAQAPWLFLAVPILLWSAWGRSRRTALVISALVAVLIWHFVQRPHPAYMIHMVPLVLVATVLALADIRNKWFTNSVAIGSFVFSVCTGVWMSIAWSNGLRWSNDSEYALTGLSSMIDRSESVKPLVMVEASANKVLLSDTSIRLMTTHFQFFPDEKQSIESILKEQSVDYVLLFNSARYGYDRNAIDPLVKTVKENGDLVAIRRGKFFDVGRDYGNIIWKEFPQDTFFLYRIRK